MRVLRTFVRLLRYPGLLVAIIGASAVVGVVATTGSLYLDVAASSTLARTMEADAAFRLATMAVSADTPILADVLTYRTSLIERELGSPYGPPIVTIRGDVVTATSGGEVVEIRPVSRTDALDHVDLVEGETEDGLWLADVTASTLGLQVGDEVRLASADGTVDVPVAGVFVDLFEEPRTPYWASLDEFIYSRPGEDVRPPAFVLLDAESYVRVGLELGADQDTVTWEVSLPAPGFSMQEAERIRGELDRFSRTLADETKDVGSGFYRVGFSEPLAGWIAQTEEVVAQIRPPVQALMLAALVLALAVLGGAGTFLVRQRRTEFRLLDARGIGLVRIALRATGEVLLPVVIGLAAGGVVGVVLVGQTAGDGAASRDVVDQLFRSMGIVAVIAVAILAFVVARTVADLASPERGGVRRVASRMPWEVVALVLAALAFVGLRSDDAGGDIDPLFLLFPALVLACVVGVAVRGLRRLLPRTRGWGSGWSTAPYLAIRRLTSGSRGALAVLTIGAIAIGILVYAGTVARSLRSAADEAASLRVGSDAAVDYAGSFEGTGGEPVTDVVRIERAAFQSDDLELEVLLVDPSTFESAAFWNASFSDASLDELMGTIDVSDAARVPIVVAGDVQPDEEPVLSLPGLAVPVEVVGRATAFPGMVGERPVVVADRDAMERAVEALGSPLEGFVSATEVWGHGTEEDVTQIAIDGGAVVLSSVSAVALRDTPSYLAVSSMLRLLMTVGVIASSVVVVVAALYLAARQRQTEVAYALARRMGLTRTSSRRSLLVEVLGLLGAAVALGAVVAVAASWLVAAETQARVVEAEAAHFRIPGVVFAATVGSLLVFAFFASVVVQRRADRADVAEVMRGAE